ncbi:MAG: acyltransferase [Roseateles depolymerans]|uniref:Acyltransferase n=1 Tax=Roseateles depolymerans TaxID=76731 RepID=A0A2W5DSD2_9BURK|nr:MAG: acyltransferase [Roseateles depolymerans]
MKPTSSAVIVPIQALRFAAALLVALGHLRHAAGQLFADFDFGPFNAHVYAAGVDVFFVISGFIIYTACHADFGRPAIAPRFLLKRLIRIAPMYWAFTVLFVLATGFTAGHWPAAAHLLSSLLFLPSPNAQQQPLPVYSLGWTLNFEMLFYALMSLALLLPGRRGPAALVAAVVALAAAGLLLAPAELPWALWCQPIVLEFLFGLLIARWRLAGLRLAAPQAGLLIALGIAGLLLGSQWGEASPLWAGRAFCMGLPAALIVTACAGLRVADARTRGWRLAVLGGDASYALYLVHPFVIGAAERAGPRWQLLGPAGFMALTLLATLLAALLVHRGFEQPLQRRLTQFFFTRPPAAAGRIAMKGE